MSANEACDPGGILAASCARAGLDPAGASILRMGENAIYRLADSTVVRIARPGHHDSARGEVAVADWLAHHDVAAVTTRPDITQPVNIDDHAVTFWNELPPHRNGKPAEVATALRRLHQLPPPTDFDLPQLDPFARLPSRIDAATTLSQDDRAWLHTRVGELRHDYQGKPRGLADCVVHGDAWVGNITTTDDGVTVLLDLERFSIGPPEWDLVSTAIKHTSFGWITERQYHEFTEQYGHDVTSWAGFTLFRDIRELRMTCYLAQQAGRDHANHDEAQLRIDCLRSVSGPRPWTWRPAA